MKRVYDQVTALLSACGVPNTAAEVHGLVCGQVSGGPGVLRIDLTARLLGIDQALPPAMEKLILGFAVEIAEQLGSGDFSFQPLLPADDEELSLRVQALAHWCEGFNAGFAAGYAGGQSAVQVETQEVINDFARIAQAEEGIAGDELEEQDEEDYIEILEYVRMAAASVFMQNVPAGPPGPGPDDNIH